MNHHCNLLPISFQRRLLTQTRLRQWLLVWVGTLVAISLFAAQRVYSLLDRETELTRLERLTEPLHQKVALNRKLREQLREMNSRELLAGELAGARYPLDLLGFVSRAAHPFESELQVRHFALHHESPPVRAVTTQQKAERTATSGPQPSLEIIRLTVGGIATDGLAVARFVTVLRESQVFESVELKSSIPGRIGELATREYQLVCTF